LAALSSGAALGPYRGLLEADVTARTQRGSPISALRSHVLANVLALALQDSLVRS
jgi:hypothetical protein